MVRNQESVKTAAETIARAHPVIDLLVNNAGVMAMPERLQQAFEQAGWESRASSPIRVCRTPTCSRARTPRAAGGEMYGPLFTSFGPAVKRPILRTSKMDDHIRILWEVSARETGVALDVAAAKAAL